MARITEIYIASGAGEPMLRVPEQVQVIQGKGLVGDRYAYRAGHFQKTGPEHRQWAVRDISVISLAAFDIAKERTGVLWTPAMARRNVVVDMDPDDLNSLVGIDFRMGIIEVIGTELCKPCSRPSQLNGHEDFREAFEGIGGLRAQALTSGMLAVGDEVIF